MRPLDNRYDQVLLTYLRRPAFHALGAGLAVNAGLVALLIFGEPLFQRLFPRGHRDWLVVTVFLLSLFLAVGLVATLMAHIKEQLRYRRSALVPGYSPPHIVVAAVMFTALGAALGGLLVFPWLNDRMMSASPVGCFTMGITLVTMAAYSSLFRSRWVPLLLVPIFFIGLTDHTGRIVREISFDPAIGTIPYYAENILPRRNTRLVILSADLVALLALGWLVVRVGDGPGSVVRRLLERITPRPSVSNNSLPTVSTHRTIPGSWARAWHRRAKVLGRAAPWVAGGGLAALLLTARFGFDTGPVNPLGALILATVVPGVAVGLTWRERWPTAGYESLYPARRADFARETAAAMASELAEYWLAITAAVLLARAADGSEPMLSARLVTVLAASALMQCLVFGGVLLAARSRATMSYIGVLTGLAFATALPIVFTWPRTADSDPHGLLPAAFAEMVLGVVLTAAGYAAWRRGDLV